MAITKWVVSTDPVLLRRMGKLSEELGEAQAVAARVIIQGLDEIDPSSNKSNRQRLMDELADVEAQIHCTTAAMKLDTVYMNQRTHEKIRQMGEWEAQIEALHHG